MRNVWLIIAAVLAVVLVIVAVSCRKTTVVVLGNESTIVVQKKGRLQWQGLTPFVIQFTHGSPCTKDSDQYLTSKDGLAYCDMGPQSEGGIYDYQIVPQNVVPGVAQTALGTGWANPFGSKPGNCNNCPQIVVGPIGGKNQSQVITSSPASPTVNLTCDPPSSPATATLTPNSAPVTNGYYSTWVPLGNPPSWTVVFDNPQVCIRSDGKPAGPDSPVGPGYAFCKVQGTSGTTYSYTATYQGCTVPTVQGTLKVQ